MLSFTCTATNPNPNLRQPLHVPCVQDFAQWSIAFPPPALTRLGFFLSDRVPSIQRLFLVINVKLPFLLLPNLPRARPPNHAGGALRLHNDSQHVPHPAMCIPSPLPPRRTSIPH